jgi:RND family efflux transporter MFP subunit
MRPPAVFADSQAIKPVTARSFSEVAVFPRRTAPATAISLNNAEISAEINGVVKEIPVRVGDTVETGDIVASLDCAEYAFEKTQAQAAFKQAKVRYLFDKKRLENALKLSTKKSISKEQVDQRRSEAAVGSAEVERLRASLNSAARRVEKCQVRAPFSGVVIERQASVGELAAPGTKLVRILDKDNIEISAKVQEEDLQSLQGAGALHFVSRKKAYPLRLRTVLPLVDSKIHSYEVRLEFMGLVTPPGSAGRLEWVSSAAHVPSNLLVRRHNTMGIFVAEAGKARFRPIEEAREGRVAEVALPPEVQVVVDGRYGLEDGDLINVVSP